MSVLPTLLTLDELTRLADAGTIESVLVVFPDLYGRFMGKRLDATFFLNAVAKAGMHACNYLFTVDMEMNPVSGYQFANWGSGYGDFLLAPDLNTLRVAHWQPNTAMVICDVMEESSKQLICQAPRAILKQQLSKAAERGYTVKSASELEYYVFKNPYSEAYEKDYFDLTPAGWYIGDYNILQNNREEAFNSVIRRHLRQSGVEIEGCKSEWGLGQQEFNMRFCDVMNMADNHSIFKQCAKDVAEQMELSVTFMAKYKHDQAGSSCHIHLSLWQNEQNAFSGDVPFEEVNASDAFRWFLGGWIKHTPELMVFYAPTVNSYKRFRHGSWAPTRLAWAFDNRTVAFRIVGRGRELRIECRIPGADCNPYLAYSAALASGLSGIANQIEPPPLFKGDAYVAPDVPHLPSTFLDAIERFEQSSFAVKVFGKEVVEHYAHFYRSELEEFDRVVTDWERRRYFERI
jgi:glutamine synthetase